MDRFTPQKRSEIMRSIRARDTGPELAIRRALHRAGFRYRVHVRSLPGTPDIVFPGRRKVIFVHGCFWHGHAKCKKARLPKTRVDFWRKKIELNRKRDVSRIAALRGAGWKVLVLWQCELSNLTRSQRRAEHFLKSQ